MATFPSVEPTTSTTPSRVSYTGTEAGLSRATSPGSQLSPGTRAQPRTLSDKYQLGEELGRGAYGLVFKGIDTRTGDCVAIKQLSLAGISAETLHSIMGEIDLLKNLNHKNIVKYIGSFKTRTHLYIILEFMENGALSNIIKPTKFGAFPESLVAVYIAQVLQGLAYLHDQGVVHRDIKGANILTTKEGLVKLADFGVAARLSELEADRDKSRLSVVGTPYWMAPEVIEMTSTTPASDIWSVACLAIELLTGQPPYFDLLPMSALFRIVQDESPELPTDLSADMTDFLQQCFRKDPQRRPTARQLLRHRWVTYNRQTLRSSWSRTQGMKSRGQKTDAHVSVSTVVERILQAEADEFAASAAAAAQGKPLPAGAENSSKASPQIPMNQSRVASVSESRESSADGVESQESAQTALDRLEVQPGQAPPEASLPPSKTVEQPPPPPRLEAVPERGNELSSRASSRANSIRLQGHRGLLEPLFRIGGPGMQDPGEDLLHWLQQKERNHMPDSILPETLKLSGEELVDGAVNKHQEVAEVRRLIAALRKAFGRFKSSRDGNGDITDRTAAAIEGGAALLSLCRDDSDRIEGFLAEDGGVTLIELLQDPASEQVALLALQILNELISMDTKALGAVALLGVVPIVAQYAGGPGPHEVIRTKNLRLQAALFLQQLAKLNLVTAQLLIASQGLPVVVGLIEPNFSEHGQLVRIGVNCIWRLLELHGMLPLNQICRLLAVAGLASNLVHALKSATAQARLKDTKRLGGKQPVRLPGRQEGANLEPQVASRASSHSQASARSAVEEPAVGAGVSGMPSIGSGSFDTADTSEGLHVLLDRMANLLLVMAHADTAVKATLCQPDTLKTLFSAIELAPETLQLTALKAIKYLTTDPSMLEALQESATIESLGRYLNATLSLPIQVEALHALHNLCKISRQRQEGAAKAGLVPYLMALAQMSPAKAATEPLQEELRQMAVSLLCGMAHSTQLTRSYLWSNNGLHTLLDLLREEDWQGPALDALAAWLAEDPGRIEPRLTQRSPVESFVQLFASYVRQGGSDALARLLEPFLRILRRSPQITVEVAVAGLAGIVVEMLRTASALTALSLLQMVKVIYEHHPRPKEFVAKYAITDRLRELSRQQNSSVLVKKQAAHLLHAFQINSVF